MSARPDTPHTDVTVDAREIVIYTPEGSQPGHDPFVTQRVPTPAELRR